MRPSNMQKTSGQRLIGQPIPRLRGCTWASRDEGRDIYANETDFGKEAASGGLVMELTGPKKEPGGAS